jgi:hypothetical protein
VSGRQLTVTELGKQLVAAGPDKPVIANGWPVIGVRDAGAVVEVEVLVNEDPEDVAEPHG